MHYYSEEQKSPLKLRKIKANLLGQELEFISGSGVFSSKKIDKGAEVLIKNCIVKKDGLVLDLGCGYGAIGIAIAKKFPLSQVILTDINKRAVKLAKTNLELNQIENAEALYSNKFEKIDQKFDVILLNPPQTAGKEVCFAMIQESEKFLNNGGSLQLVARHKKGGKGLEKKMEEVFGNVEQIAKKSGFRVYLSKK